MAFSDYRNYDQVIEKYKLGFRREEFIPAAQDASVDPRFRADMELNWREFPFQRSEAAASHALIFPILREVWKDYRSALLLLSQEPIRFDDDLAGVVDFVVAKKSSRSDTIPERPFLLVGEAKNDEFYRGWGQAISAMLAVQRLQGDVIHEIFGLATNGMFWQFGKLVDSTVIIDERPFTPARLDDLMAALHFVFAACREQVLSLPTAA